MKSRIFKPIAMFILALFVTVSVKSVFAQDATRTTDAKEKPQNDEEFKKSYNDKMAKFDEYYSKLKQKQASTNDPAMKSDLDKMISKMDGAKADMDKYEANRDKMTPEERDRAQANIKSQMGDIKQMHDAAHSKYGKGEKSGEKQGANQGEKTGKQGVNEGTKAGTTTTTTTDTQDREAAKKENAQKEKKAEKKEKVAEGDTPK